MVERRIKGKKGSLQLWVEEVISEKGRRQQGLQAPDQGHWTLQVQNMTLFDNLINNIDRNQGNILIDKNWEIWLIDHGRSFSQDWHLPQEAGMKRCGQRLWKAVEALDENAVRSRLGPYLDGSQITALFKRREQILDIFRQRIASEGEAEVLVAPE